MHPELRIFLSATAFLVASGCGGCDESTTDPSGGGTAGSGTGAGAEGGSPPTAPPASPKALVKLKTGDRFRNDVARALSLEPNEVCNELGAYECSMIHQVVMGRAEPYVTALYEPIESTSATSPLAYERLAVSACVRRVDADITVPDGVLFSGLPIANGALTDPTAPEVESTVQNLYRRALSRDATPQEVAKNVAAYGAILEVDGQTAARSWALATCVAVLTSVENVFY